jgi:hypothetical protein
MIFGATFVFKISPNFAFKNILENGVLIENFDFKSFIQNLFRISKCALKQSCRELNFKQLLFWGQLLKMPFSSSKIEFEMI